MLMGYPGAWLLLFFCNCISLFCGGTWRRQWLPRFDVDFAGRPRTHETRGADFEFGGEWHRLYPIL